MKKRTKRSKRIYSDIIIRITPSGQYEVSFAGEGFVTTHFTATIHPCNFPAELKELMAAMDIVGTMNLLKNIGRKTNDKIYMIYPECGLDPFELIPYPSIRAIYLQFTAPLQPLVL